MKKVVFVMIALVAVTMLAPAAFAQGTGATPLSAHAGIFAIAGGFGMALAAFAGAFGHGRIAGAACEGMARNPGAAGAIRAAMILGLVFVETLSLLTFVAAIIILLKI
jgi:F-type H+-transporting ATPase subunit c